MASEVVQKQAKVTEKPKPNHKYNRDKDREKVRGKFIFHEVPGGTMQCSTRFYKEDPVENWTFVDGQIYSIPLGVAKHLNKNCWYPEYEFAKNEDMQNVQRIGRKTRRCSFQSLEFVDIEDLTPTPELYTVENIS
jgi:hypothetical protein